MNFYLDTEFFEDGPHKPIQLISIALVAEDGRELYYENADVDMYDVARRSPWLRDNVIPHLTGPSLPHQRIGSEILNFVVHDKKPVFWTYFGDYDWVLFCQLFGRMVDLPDFLPYLALDLKQEMIRLGVNKPKLSVSGPEHNALADARWNKALHEYLKDRDRRGPK